MTSRDLIAVIPAAGPGSRMGTTIPKLFLEVKDGLRICDFLLARVATVTCQVHLVLSPEGLAHFEALGRPAPPGVDLTYSVQPKPDGMGDAVFGAREYWRTAPHLLIVWGDQLGVSARTLARTAARQCDSTAPSLTLPLVHSRAPYVHYELDASTWLRVAQAREGDECPPHGLSDVGTFALSTEGLDGAWQRYSSLPESRGARTGELNLLPFFAHLARREGFALQIV